MSRKVLYSAFQLCICLMFEKCDSAVCLYTRTFIHACILEPEQVIVQCFALFVCECVRLCVRVCVCTAVLQSD